MSDEAEPSVVAIAAGRDAEALADEVLLLSALGIPHALRARVEPGVLDAATREVVALETVALDAGSAVELVVAADQAEEARRELAGLERDLLPSPQPVLRDGARAAIPAGLVLLLAHALLGLLPAARRAAVYAAGELDARRVLSGELYRAATALTLHADAAHVGGNAVATAIFVSAAGDWVGPGVALACTIAAGVLGNLAAAFFDPSHRAIGFSTATFGALGLTAVFGFVARYRDRLERRRAWLALGAGVALLALLGAGERSDLLAHLFGLAAGALIGVVVVRSGPLRARRPVEIGALGQGLSTLFAVAVLVLAWLRALG